MSFAARPNSSVVTLGENSQIVAIEQQAKWFKSHTSAFAVIDEFRSIWLKGTSKNSAFAGPVPANQIEGHLEK
jgi:hypothetical protein